MKSSTLIPACAAALCLATSLATAAPKSLKNQEHFDFTLTPIGTHTNGPPFNTSAAEIVAHDPATQRLYVVNAQGTRIDVLDIQDPTTPTKIAQISLAAFGAVVNSVAVHGHLIAVAVEGARKTDLGKVVVMDDNYNLLNAIPAGALPDMVTFSPDGRWLLCANEGEPNTYNNFGSETNGPSIDPEGSITVIDLSTGVATPTVRTATFTAFNNAVLDPSVRIYGPGATVAQDMEPEYITISDDSKTAWVTLQENNAIATVDLRSAQVTRIDGLGFKDHSLPGNGFDGSDQDGGIFIRPWPVRGIYNPDSIVHYKSRGQTYLVMANEGDTREWPGFREDVRLSTRTLDPTNFPNGAVLKLTNNLGRLAVSSVDGDTDHDGDLDAIYSYGARSFSIRTVTGGLVWDSGDELEQITAALYPLNFNASHSNNTLDNRSPSKGPEPEGVVVGKAYGRTLAFIGLERIGGIAVYDISDPFNPEFEDYVNNRTFTNPFNFATGGDLGPEGLAFISAEESPNGQPLLVVAHEISGTTTIFQLTKRVVKKSLIEFGAEDKGGDPGSR